MKPHFAHPSLKRLAGLEPLNARRLDERIYQEILAGGQEFSPATSGAHQPAIELLVELMDIHEQFKEEAGPWEDMFGQYMEGTFQLNGATGQFFTPMSLVRMIVKCTVPHEKEELEARPQWICDPACGSGRFMIGIAEHYAETIHCMNFCIVNIDVDRRAATYCTMNAILKEIPSINIWGNALSLEVYDAYVVLPGYPTRWPRMSKERARGLMVSALKRSEKPAEVPKRAGQMGLAEFGVTAA